MLMLSRALQGVSSLFESNSPPAERKSWELPLLGLFVLMGAAVRFWGLGSYGLHGDEETMAMPTLHIVEHGTPHLPSGMFYPRAIAQLYMMAASVMAFGQSEWALRLPSVLCGLLLIVLAYFLGRRFLSPIWNMGFVSVVTFLPGLIADSQEARMYIFLLASLAGYAILIFRWERTGRLSDLIFAVLVMLVAIQFHQLAVFGAFLALFPGLARGDLKKLLAGMVAFALIGLAHSVVADWVGRFYPERPFSTDSPSEYVAEVPTFGPTPIPHELLFQPWQIVLAVVIATAFSVFVAGKVERRLPAVLTGVLLLLGLLAQAGLYYHAAFWLLLAGAIVAQRNGGKALPRLVVLLAVSAAAAVGHLVTLHLAGITPFRKVIGAMIGQPSIWPLLQVGEYSRVAWLLSVIGFGRAIWLLIRGERIPDYWLVLILGVWVPLASLGLFSWYVPPRYAEFALLPLLIVALAAFQRVEWYRWRESARPAIGVALCALLSTAVINPLAVARTVNAGYAIYPDHKGAAEYMLSIELRPTDLVLAEDVLQQTYYLGRVDYWLIGRHVALQNVERVGSEILDLYTHTPVIGTGEELTALLHRPDRGTIYVIGSGEHQHDGRRFMQAFGIFEVLHSSAFEVVYVGRDGLTKVWKAAQLTSAATPLSASGSSQ